MMAASSVFRQIVTPPLISIWRRPTLEPTGVPAQGRGAAGGDCLAAALDFDKSPPAVTDPGGAK